MDDICQAATIAFLDEVEVNAVETAFASHAREVGRRLRAETPPLTTALPVVQVKNPEELDPGYLGSLSRQTRCRVHLLILPEIRDAVLTHLGGQQEDCCPDRF